MPPIPLLIISDPVSSSSGLARITRELAARIHLHLSSHFIVATLGLGESPADPALPWKQYSSEVADGTIPVDLPHVWRDFLRYGTGKDNGILLNRGIVLVIQNPSWVNWLSHPEQLRPSELKEFLMHKPFKKWIYCPIDGDGPNPNYLPQSIANILARFDRRLAYCAWAAQLMDRTIGAPAGTTPHLPHGCDTTIFRPRDRQFARSTFVQRLTGQDIILADSSLLVGIIATNSSRKDWPLALDACRILRGRGVNIRIWAHTNTLVGAWNLPELVEEFRLDGITLLSTRQLSDEDLASCYSACDAVLSIGSGEGWGYCGVESMACGTPIVHGNYAAGPGEFIPPSMLVEPIYFRGDGRWGIRRPVHSPAAWADKILELRGQPADLPPYIDWSNAWPAWSTWLMKGIA